MSIKSFFLLLASVPMSACVQTTPHWDSQFGQSTRDAIASQSINPAAAANRDAVTGVDGTAALGAQKRYEQTFAQPEAHTASMLGHAGGK
jgi:hypothetical protein